MILWEFLNAQFVCDQTADACKQHEIQERYSAHRTKRNAQQKEKLCDPAFQGVLLDTILQRLEDPTLEPGFKDERHCLVLWARPPLRLRNLIADIQQKLRAAAPHLWIMPPDNLHMTALEITHSRTQSEIDTLVAQLRPHLPVLVDAARQPEKRARLHSPLLSFDAQGIALSFLPAAGEALPSGRNASDDEYSYHHLRRDLYTAVGGTGVEVGSRYVVPSAHLTVARFIDACDFEEGGKSSPQKMRHFVEVIEEVNEWLQAEYWPKEGSTGMQWMVGEERGLDCREGTLWYGTGKTVLIGQGF